MNSIEVRMAPNLEYTFPSIFQLDNGHTSSNTPIQWNTTRPRWETIYKHSDMDESLRCLMLNERSQTQKACWLYDSIHSKKIKLQNRKVIGGCQGLRVWAGVFDKGGPERKFSVGDRTVVYFDCSSCTTTYFCRSSHNCWPEFLEHEIPAYSFRGTDLFSLRLSN